MKITCLCYTHGRGHVIGEAVESFLRQEPCSIETELLIVNDCPEQPLIFNHPRVTIQNIPICNTVSEKFNRSIELCDGDYIAIWEDDDISLPHRLRHSIYSSENLQHNYKQLKAWFWNNGSITSLSENLFFGNALFKKSDWINSGGAQMDDYPDVSGHHAVLNETEKRGGKYVMEDARPEDVFFIYRWGGMEVTHDSSIEVADKDFRDRFKKFRQAVLTHPKFVPGPWEIKPYWEQDYVNLTKNAIELL